MTELTATLLGGESWDAVEKQIKDHLEAFAEGGPDLTETCLALGKAHRLDWVEAAVYRAKGKRIRHELIANRGDKIVADIAAGEAKRKVEAEPEPEPEPTEPLPPAANLPAVVPPCPPLVALEYAQIIPAMNERHAVIENVGGKAFIVSLEPAKHDPSRLTVAAYQTKDSFMLRYSNSFVPVPLGDGRVTKMGLAQFWLTHRDRRQHRGVIFEPGGPGVINGSLNIWQGWGVKDRQGDCELICQHIENVIAGGNADIAYYVFCWLAWSIQNPDKQAEVALVLVGEKGTGKGTFARCLERIFGAHAFLVNSKEEVVGRFNGHLQDCVMFIADEAYWGGDKRCIGRLQGMITEPTLPIERKGIDIGRVPNRLHVVMLAEPGWVIPAGRFERRYAAMTVSNVRRGDKDCFRALYQQIADGGAEAMFHYMRNVDLDGWHPREIPEALLNNPELRKQQGLTLSPMEQWFLSVLHDGRLPSAINKRPNTTLTKHLMEQIKERVPRLKWDVSEVSVRNFLTDAEAIGVPCEKYRATYANGWSFAPLADLREAWVHNWGPVKWDNEMEEWS